MTDTTKETVRLADLSGRRETPFTLAPDGARRAAIAADLGIPAVRKLRFEGRLVPVGGADWDLVADLGATVVQECVVTLAPVTTRIDEVVTRRYRAEMPEPEGGVEIEMPEDDTAEPLPAAVDLARVMTEALALALPPWPRAEGAEFGQALHAEPGVAPMTDEDTKPFAGLAGLRDSLPSGDDPESGGKS